MSKEAMKLALEALENLCEHLPFDWAFDELKSLAGKDEYREDLAKARSLIPIIEEALAKQEHGKPVALETVYETIINWDEGGGKRSRRELARQIVALYTIQQQRKPLTDEQVMDLCAEQWASHPVEVARIIEAAHGIKE